MSKKSKISNLSNAEKSIKDKQGPKDEKGKASPCSEDSQQEKSDVRPEAANS